MRTSVDIPDDLLREAKRVALQRNSTLRELITRGLERELAGGDEPPERGSRRRSFPLIHVGSSCPVIRMSIDELKKLEQEEEAKRYRDLLARRERDPRADRR